MPNAQLTFYFSVNLYWLMYLFFSFRSEWCTVIGVFLINMGAAHILLNIAFIVSYNGHLILRE